VIKEQRAQKSCSETLYNLWSLKKKWKLKGIFKMVCNLLEYILFNFTYNDGFFSNYDMACGNSSSCERYDRRRCTRIKCFGYFSPYLKCHDQKITLAWNRMHIIAFPSYTRILNSTFTILSYIEQQHHHIKVLFDFVTLVF